MLPPSYKTANHLQPESRKSTSFAYLLYKIRHPAVKLNLRFFTLDTFCV